MKQIPQKSSTKQSEAMSYQTKTIITILLLLFFYPVGLILMWMWMITWPKWLKIALTIILTLGLLLLVVLPLVLSIITLMAINPTKQFTAANDAKRLSDLTVISNAVSAYRSSNNGQIPSGITQTPSHISTKNVDLCSTLYPQYLSALPEDPTINSGSPITDCNTEYDTGYEISVDNQGKVTVNAPYGEVQKQISIVK